MKTVPSYLFLLCFTLSVSTVDAQQSTPMKRRTPTLTTDDVRNGASSKVVETTVDPPEVAPSAEDSNAATEEARGALKNAFAKLSKVQSLRTRMKVSGGPVDAPEVVVETVHPDRTHLTNGQMEMFVIGSTSYLKVGNGDWQIINLGDFQNKMKNMQLDPSDLIDQLFMAPGVTFSGRVIGKSAIDAAQTTVYEIIGVDKKNEKGMIRVWIGDNDQLPRKMEISSNNNQMSLSFRFSDFNAPLNITPPIPH